MTTADKSLEIISKLVEIANEDRVIMLERDWGGNSLTISIDDAHTHVGMDDQTFEFLIDGLYDLLIRGRGLSWARPPVSGQPTT